MEEPSSDPDLVTTSTDGLPLHDAGRSVVVHESYIDLVLRDGDDDVVIGRVKAEFDLSRVPAEFRGMVLSSLLASGQVWMVGAVARRRDYPAIERRQRHPPTPVPPDPGPRRSWWATFLSWW